MAEVVSAPPSLQRSKGRPVGDQKVVAAKKPSAQAAANSKTDQRENGLNGIFQLGAFGLMMANQPADAAAITKHGAPIAHEAALLAETNSGAARMLDYLTEAGPYAGLITAAMPLVIQLLANHQVVKPEVGRAMNLDIVAPEALEAEAKTAQAQMAVRALHAQRDAEAALQEAQAEFQADAQRQQAAASQANASANGHRTDDGPEAPPN